MITRIIKTKTDRMEKITKIKENSNQCTFYKIMKILLINKNFNLINLT